MNIFYSDLFVQSNGFKTILFLQIQNWPGINDNEDDNPKSPDIQNSSLKITLTLVSKPELLFFFLNLRL